MQSILQHLPLAGQSQAEAVVKAAKAWLAAPLGQSARSKRAFVRNRADEVLPLLDADGQGAVLAVLVANYEAWHEKCRQFPLEVQAMVLDHLLALRVRAGRSLPLARRLARPLRERARAIRQQADALEARIRRELRERAAKLQLAASKNRKRGLVPIAAEQERQARALLQQAGGAIGGCDHPLAAEVRHLRQKEAQVRAEATAERALPKTLVGQIDAAIAFAIAPDALKHLETPKQLLALRLASPLSAEWRAAARRCLRFPTAGAALADAWEQLQRAARQGDGDEPTLSRDEAGALLATIEQRLALHRAAADPSLRYVAPEGIARALFPKADPVWISSEAALMRLAEELRRVAEAPCVDEVWVEKIDRLAAHIEATKDSSRIAELHRMQRAAAKAELRERARAVRAFEVRKRAKMLRVPVRELLLR